MHQFYFPNQMALLSFALRELYSKFNWAAGNNSASVMLKFGRKLDADFAQPWVTLRGRCAQNLKPTRSFSFSLSG